MRTLWIGLAVSLFTPNLSPAQLGERWVAHHNGSGDRDDYGTQSAVDSKGDVFVTGGATNAEGVIEMLTVKIDASGTKQWSRTYEAPGGGPDYGFAVEVDGDDNVIVLGDSVGVGTGYDLVTLKYTPDGELAWAQRYDGPASDYDGTSAGLSLGVDASGNVIVSGYSEGIGTGHDVVVLKYSPSGALLWEERYVGSGASREYCYSLDIDTAGNICLTGEAPDVTGHADFLVLKYDANGNLLWQQQYDGPAHGADYVFNIAVGPSDELVITGFSPGVGTHDDIATIKYDAQGNLQWVRRYDGPDSKDDAGIGVAVSATGLVAVTGEVERTYDSAAVTLLYDASGNLLWARTHDVSPYYYGEDVGIDVAFDGEGNVFAAGAGWDGPEFGVEAFLVEYAPDGSPLFAGRYDGPAHGDDEAFAVAVHADGVHIAGLSQRGSQHLDLFAVKYEPATGFTSPSMAPLERGDDPPPARVQSPPKAAQWKPREPRSPFPLRPRSLLRQGLTSTSRR